MAEKRTGMGWGKISMKKIANCKACANQFTYCDKSNQGIYCSLPCKYKGSKGQLKTIKCLSCSKEISWTTSKKRLYCSLDCFNNQTISKTNEIISINFEIIIGIFWRLLMYLNISSIEKLPKILSLSSLNNAIK